MEEKKHNGKLQSFVRAILDAANAHSDAIHDESDRHEKAVLEDYRDQAERKGRESRAHSLSDAAAREEKRVMTETLAARRSLLEQRAACEKQVLDDVRARLAAYPGTEEYAATLERLLRQGLGAMPEAKSAHVLLRHEDAGHISRLRAAAQDVELSFGEGFMELGGLIIEFPEQHRRADLTFDTALEDAAERFAEITGFGMEEADGQ